RRALLISALSLILAACGGGGGSNSPTPEPGDGPGGGGDGQTRGISGRLTMPDGSTPLANATVYVPSAQTAANAVIRTVGVNCQEPAESYSAAACTKADGSFQLDVDYDATMLKAVKGSFEMQIPLSAG